MPERILIIDDDTELLALLRRFLKDEGFDAESAPSGDVGIEKTRVGSYA